MPYSVNIFSIQTNQVGWWRCGKKEVVFFVSFPLYPVVVISCETQASIPSLVKIYVFHQRRTLNPQKKQSIPKQSMYSLFPQMSLHLGSCGVLFSGKPRKSNHHFLWLVLRVSFFFQGFIIIWNERPSLKVTQHLKMYHGNTGVLLGWPISGAMLVSGMVPILKWSQQLPG